MSKRRLVPQNKPRNVEVQNAARTEFYRDMLRRVTKGIFKLDCPEYCDRDYILNELMFAGYFVVSDTPAGVLPLKASLHGYNYMNVQTNAIIKVPTLKRLDRVIGKDCEIVYLERKPSRVFYTFTDLIDIYASKLSLCDAGIDVNVLNSKLAWIAEAESKAQAETIKSIMDRITEGEPLVVYKKESLSGNPLNLFFNNLGQNFIAGDIQDVKRTIVNEYLTYIGVNNANTDKKERLVTTEVNANNEELLCNTTVWRDNLNKCMEKVKKMFPDFKMSLELQFDCRTEMVGDVNDIRGSNRDLGDKKPSS